VARADVAAPTLGLAAIGGPARRQTGGSTSLAGRFRRDRLALVGLAVLLAVVAAAILAPVLTRFDPASANPAQRLEGPSLVHFLGTDNLGRDVVSRLLFGSRWSLGTAGLATLLIMTIGVTVGSVAGYYGGWADDAIVLVIDVLLAFPSLVLALAIAGTLGPGIVNVMLGLVCVWWVGYARVVRGLVLSTRHRQFVEAARCLGARDRRIIVRHVLPNVLAPVVVLATLEMGGLILAISGLSFLGLGAQPPTPEWGAMLNDGRSFLQSAPQLMIYPGLAISLVVVAFNLLGDGLRDALDPRSVSGGRR
jgi:peptide/nickel transport system permease protein